jgi:hypothetical protein
MHDRGLESSSHMIKKHVEKISCQIETFLIFSTDSQLILIDSRLILDYFFLGHLSPEKKNIPILIYFLKFIIHSALKTSLLNN